MKAVHVGVKEQVKAEKPATTPKASKKKETEK